MFSPSYMAAIMPWERLIIRQPLHNIFLTIISTSGTKIKLKRDGIVPCCCLSFQGRMDSKEYYLACWRTRVNSSFNFLLFVYNCISYVDCISVDVGQWQKRRNEEVNINLYVPHANGWVIHLF